MNSPLLRNPRKPQHSHGANLTKLLYNCQRNSRAGFSLKQILICLCLFYSDSLCHILIKSTHYQCPLLLNQAHA